MESFSCDGVLTALSSISHNGGQTFGITSKLRREKFAQPDGSVEEVPVLSGNGIRGRLRDLGMQHMLASLGYGENGEGINLPAFHFLFSGGSLTGSGKAINVGEAKRIRSLMPLVGIFGGAMGNSILPGILKCGKAIPICTETRHLLPEKIAETANTSIWDYLQEEMHTRRDDLKNDRFRKMLDERTRLMIEADDAAKSNKAGTEAIEATGQSQQMMYYTETFIAGTRFFWRLLLDDPTEIEMEAFMTCLVQFSKIPFLGGKSNIGMGEVSMDLSQWMRIDTRNIGGTGVDMPAGNRYQKHLSEKAPEIRKTLETLQ